ncbi:OB-fold domain-containing protein [Novosphingobium resinovorum]|uniref:Zn-ribbon domain-containing OB-fold protein n=1 Tax=Novosphingobium resinovorum TaxID=158500 RepID=UPI002ED603D7|nr:OB-fold domain-containing protein [Novosphingobium resinovorum]
MKPETRPDHLPPPIADDLIAWDAGQLRLVASREKTTGHVVFPPRSEQDDRFERILLPAQGRLWSWTIQRFRPKSPPYAGAETFEPYAVGYVALDDALIVEARLSGVAFDALRIGMPMRLVPQSFLLASGDLRTTFAFSPIDGEQP